MKILAIDSSGMPASAAVVENGKLIAAYTVNYQKTHSQTLLPMIDELSRAIELDKTTLGAVAVSGGPGSFTGLRIGSATAKGIALALKIPIINVPTLEGLASNYHGCSELICPMMDARRTEVFAGVYTYQDDLSSVSSDKTSLVVLMDQKPVSVEELCIKLNKMAEKTGKRLILLGDGCVKYRDILNEKLTAPYRIAPLNLLEQRAASVALRAEELLAAGRTETAEEHRPIYLRVSQAERVRSCRLAEKSPIRIRPAEEKDLPRIAVMAAGIPASGAVYDAGCRGLCRWRDCGVCDITECCRRRQHYEHCSLGCPEKTGDCRKTADRGHAPRKRRGDLRLYP